jgi:hypothetical protein
MNQKIIGNLVVKGFLEEYYPELDPIKDAE